MQEFHRELFTNSADELRQEIKRITGVEVREATAEVETTTGTVVQVFTTGTMVQVSCSPGAYPRTVGAATVHVIHPEKGGSTMLVLSRKEQGIGSGRRG